MKRITDEDKTI